MNDTAAHPLALIGAPHGWAWGVVGDVAEIQSGFPSGQHNSRGVGVPHLRPMNIDLLGRIDLGDVRYVNPSAGALRLAPGDVLFNNTNSPALVGKTACFSKLGDFAFSNHMTRLRCGENIEPRFLAFQLHWLWMAGYFRLRCTNHVNQASISGGTLGRTVPILIPPMVEQLRIVEIIEEQFSRLEAAEASIERSLSKIEYLKLAAITSALRLADSTVPLGTVASVISGPAFKSQNFGKAGEGVRLLRGENIEPGALRWTNTRTWPRDQVGPYEHLYVSENDIILAMDRPVISTGLKLALVKESDLPALLVQRVARIRPHPTVNTSYLFLALSQTSFVRHVLEDQTGTQLPHITLAGIRAFHVPMLPLPEQQRLVRMLDARLSVFEDTAKLLSAGLRRSLQLRRAILEIAFRGRLVARHSGMVQGTGTEPSACAKAESDMLDEDVSLDTEYAIQ